MVGSSSSSSSVVMVVPWFSKDEWIETYEAAFSSDVNCWKNAKDTMLVWQARVEKLPAGIDVTLPLLQAKIIEMDPTVEESVRPIFLASALQRFVTSIVKLPQTKYYRAQSMHNLALEIGLPMHLVDLRNEIVHGHGGWGGSESVRKALDVSYKWIKGFYWDREFQKMQLNLSSLSRITTEDWQSFLSLLRKYSKLTFSYAKKKIPAYHKVKESLFESLEAMYCLEPEECAKAVVHHVLLPDASSDLTKQFNTGEMCHCGCCVDTNVLERVGPVLACFGTYERGLELLLLCLIRKGNESLKLSTEWICILCGALLDMRCFSSQENHCVQHSLMLEEPETKVDWRRVLMELLETQSQWALDIAGRIIDSPKASLSDGQKEKIMHLFHLFSESLNGHSMKDSKSCGRLEGFYTVDDILTAAKNLPLGSRRKLEKIRMSTIGPTSGVTDDSPLGVLAHQNDNSLLYKDMLLHYPDSQGITSACKRRKLQATPAC